MICVNRYDSWEHVNPTEQCLYFWNIHVHFYFRCCIRTLQVIICQTHHWHAIYHIINTSPQNLPLFCILSTLTLTLLVTHCLTWSILAALFPVKKSCHYLTLTNFSLEMPVSSPTIEGMQASKSRSFEPQDVNSFHHFCKLQFI